MPTRAVGPISMIVCSPASKRVASLRGADGLAAGLRARSGQILPDSPGHAARRSQNPCVLTETVVPFRGHGGPLCG